MPGGGIARTNAGYALNPTGVLRPESSAGERRVAAADRGHPALGLLPVFLAAQGGQVEPGVGAAEDVGAAGEGRVGVLDPPASYVTYGTRGGSKAAAQFHMVLQGVAPLAGAAAGLFCRVTPLSVR
jgi:hypothetical protein